MKAVYSYLALGDSYTIGESVMLTENFPYQVVQILREKGTSFHAPEIVAKTGWTTAELLSAMRQYRFEKEYSFVSLLIGVNNQYRGQDITIYENEFLLLLQKAIAFAGNKNERVVVLSIPDWGVTPFAKDRDRDKIAEEIDAYNKVNHRIAKQHNIKYIDITGETREALHNPDLVAPDGLHPSPIDYRRWSQKVADFFASTLF